MAGQRHRTTGFKPPFPRKLFNNGGPAPPRGPGPPPPPPPRAPARTLDGLGRLLGAEAEADAQEQVLDAPHPAALPARRPPLAGPLRPASLASPPPASATPRRRASRGGGWRGGRRGSPGVAARSGGGVRRCESEAPTEFLFLFSELGALWRGRAGIGGGRGPD